MHSEIVTMKLYRRFMGTLLESVVIELLEGDADARRVVAGYLRSGWHLSPLTAPVDCG